MACNWGVSDQEQSSSPSSCPLSNWVQKLFRAVHSFW